MVNTLEKSALLVEPEHYKELMDSMNAFAHYQFVKQTLIELRRVSGNRYVEGVTEKIPQLIKENEQSRMRLLKALDNLMDPMRKQINGAMK